MEIGHPSIPSPNEIPNKNMSAIILQIMEQLV